MLTARRRTMALALLLVAACDGQNPTEASHDARLATDNVAGAPGSVADLAVSSATDTSVTLTFTEVSDGMGQPASYDVRYAANTLTWGSATPVARGTCASPVAGSSVGTRKSCTVTGLLASASYALQLVAFRGTLNLNAVFGALSNVAAGATTVQVVATPPATVNDLSVGAVTDTSITLAFTEVAGGAGAPANYDVRYSLKPLTWWLASSVTRGTCSTTLGGLATGSRRTCTIFGLGPSSTYDVQLVAFRGTLNQNAVFGALSNVASATTAPAGVASVTVTPALTNATIGASSQFTAVVRDAAGQILTDRSVSWSSNNTVASVSPGGLATAALPGIAVITAVAGGKTGSASMSVTAPPPMPATGWTNEAAGLTTMTDNPFDALDVGGWATAWNYNGWITPATDPVRGNVIRWNYPVGFTGGHGPGMEYYDHAPAKEVFAGFWWMASDPWQNHPSQVNKLAFWYTVTAGQNMHMRMYGMPPYQLEVVAEFPSGTARFQPNVNVTPVALGTWHKIEWHVKYATSGTSGDGIVEWWMDGILQGRYNTLQSPDDAGFMEYQVSPTWGGLDGVKTENDYFQYDAMHLSRR